MGRGRPRKIVTEKKKHPWEKKQIRESEHLLRDLERGGSYELEHELNKEGRWKASLEAAALIEEIPFPLWKQKVKKLMHATSWVIEPFYDKCRDYEDHGYWVLHKDAGWIIWPDEEEEIQDE